MHNTVKHAKETAPGRGRHACDQAPQPRQAGSLAAVTLIRGARCQSRLLLYPDDLHFSSGSWGRHSGVINSHVHVHTQTAGSARQWLAHWLSRQGRSSVASCHGGGCSELQPRSRRWGEEGKLPLRVGGGHSSSPWKRECITAAFERECPQTATRKETKVPAQKGCAVLYLTVPSQGQ